MSRLSSKKFLAFLVAEATWKLLIGLLLMKGPEMPLTAWWISLAMVITAGCLELGYIGGQAWLDRYVRLAEIGADAVDGEGPK